MTNEGAAGSSDRRGERRMASLKDMRVRIASTKATQKITKAMQMVAASKLRRAQAAAEAARPYAEKYGHGARQYRQRWPRAARRAAAAAPAPAVIRCTCCWSAPASAGCAARSIPSIVRLARERAQR